ncbi:MAG: RnfABCDGE type electron transport complex subunit D [Treponema sp.]
MFNQKKNTEYSAPFIYTSMNTIHIARLCLVLLAAQIVAMAATQDIAGITNIFFTVLGVFSAAFLTRFFEHKKIYDIHTLLTGVLIGFFLPTDSGFMFSFTIAFMSYFLSWGIFGGKGGSWINPVMLAVCIASLSQPDIFMRSVPAIQAGAPDSMFNALEAAGFQHNAFDKNITPMLNSVFLHSAGVTLPEGYITLFILFPSTIPACRYNILTIIASIILFATGALTKTLAFTCLILYGALIYIFSSLPFSGTYGGGDILYAWLTGSTLFSVFFTINDFGSIPRSTMGRFFLGCIMGILCFFIAGPAPSPTSIAFAVLLSNCVSPIIEQTETYYYKKKRDSL